MKSLLAIYIFKRWPTPLRLRFAHLRHPDTRHITAVQETSSQFSPLADTFVRKSSPAFLSYQYDDTAKKLKHQERVRFVLKVSICINNLLVPVFYIITSTRTLSSLILDLQLYTNILQTPQV